MEKGFLKEVRIHARAGQGAITTASLLGDAFFEEGKFAYAFPHFGAARMGAPMNAFVRISERPVRLRSQVYNPDYLLIVDPSLVMGFDVFKGFKEEGIALINSEEDFPIPEMKKSQKVFFIPANKIAQEIMGRPLGNTALLGAFCAITGLVKLESLLKAINKRFSGKIAQQNIETARRGFEYLKSTSRR
ncbi:MAG: 2-oxoacid:acceptor oxidoreductase family protein [Candidatus Omnitrophica bacterium]|nr:2-oxoacid:acceptor oxidoreductase family protein [Candidatus Omnitrophota bacterium]